MNCFCLIDKENYKSQINESWELVIVQFINDVMELNMFLILKFFFKRWDPIWTLKTLVMDASPFEIGLVGEGSNGKPKKSYILGSQPTI